MTADFALTYDLTLVDNECSTGAVDLGCGSARALTDDRGLVPKFGAGHQRHCASGRRDRARGHGLGRRAVGFFGHVESSLPGDVGQSATQLPSSSV